MYLRNLWTMIDYTQFISARNLCLDTKFPFTDPDVMYYDTQTENSCNILKIDDSFYIPIMIYKLYKSMTYAISQYTIVIHIQDGDMFYSLESKQNQYFMVGNK